jgi:hypothetical protein
MIILKREMMLQVLRKYIALNRENLKVPMCITLSAEHELERIALFQKGSETNCSFGIREFSNSVPYTRTYV